jgi:hypothetical protein
MILGIGQAVLVGGTVTVAPPRVNSRVRIFLTRKVSGGVLGHLQGTMDAGNTTFTINSNNPLDTSTIQWMAIV